MRNFGKIKTTFNNLLIEDISNKSNDNKIIFKEFLKVIKESAILKTQFNVYFNIENKLEENEFKSSEFIKENINLLSKFTKEEIIGENKKLVTILNKHKLTLIKENYVNDDLHNSITNLIFKNKNIDSIVESLSKIVDYTKTNLKESKKTNLDLPETNLVGNIMVEKYNEKYNDFNEEDKKLLKSIFESNETKKETILKELKTECITLVNKRLVEVNDSAEKETLLNVKENLLNIEFIKESFNNNISKLIELKKAFND